jgi:hypothetical protein
MQIVTTISDFFRGDSVHLQLQLRDDDDQYITLAGPTSWQFWLTFKEHKTDGDILAPLQVMFEPDITNDPDDLLTKGIIDLYLPASLTSVLPAKRLFWDIQVVYDATEIKTVAYGTVLVKRDITRDGLAGGGGK